jgi:hypothetical protein
MGEGGGTETGRGHELESSQRPFRVERRLAIPRRFVVDPHRKNSSILDHLN